MIKRLSAFLISVVLVVFLIPQNAVKAEANINIGDYVLMGKYHDEPILSRCVDIGENRSLML